MTANQFEKQLRSWCAVSVLAIGTVGGLAAQSASLLPPSAIITASAVDANGFIYLAGNLSTGDLATTPGVFEPSAPRNICGQFAGLPVYCNHGFVAKLPPSGDRLLWATYLAGNGQDTISALAVDASGRVFAAGSTTSTALLFTPTAFAPAPYSAVPASLFLYALSADASFLLGGTFFGGSAQDGIAGMTLAADGSVVIAGTANSDPFPTTPGAYQVTRDAGYSDQFVAEFNPTFKRLVFSTLIGGTEQYTASVLALGPDGTIYVGGTEGELAPGVSGHIVTRLSADGASIVYAVSRAGHLGRIRAGRGCRQQRLFRNGRPRVWMGSSRRHGHQTGCTWQSGRHPGYRRLPVCLGSRPGRRVSAFGYAQVGQLTTSPGAPSPCVLPGYFVLRAYAVQLDSQLNVVFAEFVRNGIALAGPGGVLVGPGIR